ncbi:MAG: LpqB family beta-propeller domain-containing protein [Candidatus Nanopelagicales bacterium]
MTPKGGLATRGADRRASRLLLVLLILTGCASVPRSGPIHAGPVVETDESTQFIRVIAPLPSAGATREQIVRGFLEANASHEDDWRVARAYLTPESAKSWRPGAASSVYDALGLSLRPDAGVGVVAKFPRVGEITATGVYFHVIPRQEAALTFHLKQVEVGSRREWRIADPPPGTMISQADLRRGYRLYQTYFRANMGPTLVPDGRLISVVGPSLPSALAELVLAGPAGWLAPAVFTGAPAGTALEIGSVPVNNGVAMVDLSAEALTADATARRALAAQLTWTLTQLPEVTAVRITVAGQPYSVDGAPALMDRSSWPSFGPDAIATGNDTTTPAYYTVLDGRLTRQGAANSTATVLPVTGPLAASGLAVSLDGRYAAVVEQDRKALKLLPLVRGAGRREVRGQDITSVSFDLEGVLWYVDSGEIKRVTVDSAAVTVPLGKAAAAAGKITSLRISRDGARAALVTSQGVYLAALGETGQAVTIVGAHRVENSLREVSDVAWRNAGRLVVLGRSPASDDAQVLAVDLGDGWVQALGGPAGMTALTAAPGASALVIAGKDQLYIGVGPQWRVTGQAQEVAYPG